MFKNPKLGPPATSSKSKFQSEGKIKDEGECCNAVLLYYCSSNIKAQESHKIELLNEAVVRV